jgi:hypothetical protein
MQPEIHVAFGKFQLHSPVVEIQEAEACIRTHPHGCNVQVQLRGCTLVCVKVVSRRKGPVNICRSPVVNASRLHRNIPVDVVEPRYAVRWIVLRMSSKGKSS